MPVVAIVGIDPVYFGVVFVMTSALGLITPPIGTSLNAACSIGNLRIEGVSLGMLPFLLAEIGIVILLVIFPEIITIPLSYMF